MLAHLTVNGASLRTGDLFASGTISGDEREQRGSFLELSWGGTEPFALAGSAGGRTFLEDGDEVVLRATAPGALGGRIALGEVTGRITRCVRRTTGERSDRLNVLDTDESTAGSLCPEIRPGLGCST